MDKHNAVVVDAAGVAFEMYDITVDFPWPEIRSVHYSRAPTARPSWSPSSTLTAGSTNA
ncbi:hypothetical protein QA942_41000 [Streptomyces sp. B21-106]|uniref:hypothetical protein n=1 Tax=Streptomyces sp. B21-106 TaxID=3039418 RepID=UPI002FEE7038